MANDIPVTKTAIVEDSVTHQAGEGITANMSPSLETPDIFDNTAQPAVKQVVETVPAEHVALANADKGVSVSDIATEGSTVTTPSPNINPNGVADGNATPVPQPSATTADTQKVTQAVVVEDSITHQAGDGITANMSPSLETPDIFVNEAQPAVKAVTQEVPVAQTTDGTTVITDDSNKTADTTIESQPLLTATGGVSRQQLLAGENPITENLQTLSDGSVDIPRD